jgi:hypothetical protein
MNNSDGDFLLECINLTAMTTNGGTLMKRECHATFFQEHAVPSTLASMWQDTFRKAAMVMELGPTDPEANKHAAGVGAACRVPHTIIKLEGRSQAYKDAYSSGRLAAFYMTFEDVNVMFFIVYGWTGGHDNAVAAQRTDSIF